MTSSSEALRAIKSKRTENPKTILGFYAIIVGILAAGGVSVTVVTTVVGDPRGILLPVLVFIALVIVALLVIVIILNFRDPSRLMLGKVTGDEYVDIQKITLGDSNAGERPVTLVATPVGLITSDADATSGEEGDEEE